MFLITGCSYIKDYDKPHLELTGQNPYNLTISKFTWSYGTTEINKFNGDFEKLDEKVYNLLKDKKGICKVYLESTSKDEYGKTNSASDYIGDINIDELNKFEDREYWHKNGGTLHLLYQKFILKSRDNSPSFLSDSAKMNSVKFDSMSPPIVPRRQEITPATTKVYGFSTQMLYPLADDRNSFNKNQFIVDGTITAADVDNGVMKVKETDGEEIIVQFYPDNCSSAVRNDLKLAIKPGNSIKSICAQADARTMVLVTAEITEAY
ncbi:MAG: hypothetical protein JWR05_3376 [Mucilaginibacter sp.]|nr:hypothetical protein [Mucilaginibacter sp.]